MTTINIVIETTNGEKRGYGILYSVNSSIHRAQIIDDTITVLKRIEKNTLNECHAELISELDKLGTVTTVAQSKPSQEFLDLFNKLKK